VIVIEHKLAQLLPLQPRVVVLESGRVAANGPVAQLVPEWGQRWGLRGNGRRRAPSPTNGAAPLVQLDNVRVRYNGRPVLNGVTLRVRPGEVVAVMGDNGAGKSTLLRCVVGLVEPASGRIEVMGADVGRTPTSELARSVGLIFQNPDHQLFADTVWEETTFAARNLDLMERATRERAVALLDRSGLAARLDDHPYRLSYGQKRRLNLASAVVHAPRLLLLDEPLIGQDWPNVVFLMEQVRQLARDGGAALVVAHDPRAVTHFCDRAIFLEEGQVLADGAPEVTLTHVAAHGRPGYAVPGGEGAVLLETEVPA
jgi:energy-coupling factor transport system ATP-binding protein